MQTCDPYAKADPGQRASADERKAYSPRWWLKVRKIGLVRARDLLKSNQGSRLAPRDSQIPLQPLQRVDRHGYAAGGHVEMLPASAVFDQQVGLVSSAPEQERGLAW